MKWKKAKFLDNANKWCFHEEFGICKFTISNLLINGVKYNPNYLYFLNDKTNCYEPFPATDSLLKLVDIVLHKKIGLKKNPNSYFYNYRLGHASVDQSLPESSVNVLTPNVVEVEIFIAIKPIDHNNPVPGKSFSIDFTKDDPSDKEKCWLLDDEKEPGFSDLIRADFSTIKVGDELFSPGNGKIRIAEVFDRTGPDGELFVGIDSYGAHNKIKYRANSVLFYLPADGKSDPFDIINESFDEYLLMPYLSKEKDKNIVNIYWKPVPDAAQYVVQVFKVIEQSLIYHLSDVSVDRNTFYASFDDLVGEDFVFKVKAENRSGDTLAISRGMKSESRPGFLKRH